MIAHTDAPWTSVYARHLAALGHDLQVASFAPDPIEGVSVVRLGPARYHARGDKYKYLSGVPALRRLVRRFAPDLAFAPYLISNGLAATLAGAAPLVVSARGGDVLSQPDHAFWRRRIAASLVRRICARARIVHCVSENLREHLVALGVAPDRIVQFPLGVDLTAFPLRDAAPGDAHIVCTRRHVANSDIPLLLGAMAMLHREGRRLRCTLAADGPLLDAHARLAESLGLGDCVAFAGRLDAAGVAALLRSASVYVSAARTDGASSSLLEAMAVGVIPVAARIDANRPWVRDGETGLLFTPGDRSDLARSLARALDDRALQERARARNRELVAREADRGRNLERLETLLLAAAGSPDAAAACGIAARSAAS